MRKKAVYMRITLIVVGALLILDTLIISTRSNLNLGVVMPFVIGLPLLTIGVLYPLFETLAFKYAIVRIIKWVCIAAYALFGALFVTTTLIIITCEDDYPADELDAIIVLGCGIRGDFPTLVLKNRLDRAAECYNQNKELMIIVSGGQGAGEAYSEAHVMKKYLISIGVAEQNIIEEEESYSTRENFIFSYDIINKRIGEDASIAFVTTKFHVFRASRVAHSMGIEAHGIAADDIWYLVPNNYLRECAAIVQYALSGKI